MKGGNIDIRNPVVTAPFVFATSNEATDHLVNFLLNKDLRFKLHLHHDLVDQAEEGTKAT